MAGGGSRNQWNFPTLYKHKEEEILVCLASLHTALSVCAAVAASPSILPPLQMCLLVSSVLPTIEAKVWNHDDDENLWEPARAKKKAGERTLGKLLTFLHWTYIASCNNQTFCASLSHSLWLFWLYFSCCFCCLTKVRPTERTKKFADLKDSLALPVQDSFAWLLFRLSFSHWRSQFKHPISTYLMKGTYFTWYQFDSPILNSTIEIIQIQNQIQLNLIQIKQKFRLNQNGIHLWWSQGTKWKWCFG